MESLSKSLLRKMILQYRRLIKGSDFACRNELLIDRVKLFLSRKNIKKLHTFLAMERNCEPDISPLFPWLAETGVKVIVSKTNFEMYEMRHFSLTESTALVKNKFGIPEPTNSEEASIENLDLIFVPLLLCDKEGFRIGYGGGYYDRLLSETKALKVGLSLSPPADIILQREEWDIPLDYLITPFKTYNYG
ncbi:5-formyltetrahydrofolate cyclo-ligase [Ekhidna sp.]|uniref:5-formyltetrahydrofolate cyclo-ligase n=1 Tax=Ekhidna sp. TaxID=2608089 RepID=UPI00351695AF